MASNRIVIDRTKTLGSRISDMANAGAVFREKVGEINSLLGSQGYNADASLQTDIGISAADQTRLQNLLIQATNELSGLFSIQVAVVAVGGTRQLLDALSTGG